MAKPRQSKTGHDGLSGAPRTASCQSLLAEQASPAILLLGSLPMPGKLDSLRTNSRTSDLTAYWRPSTCLIAVVAAVGAVRHNGDLRDDGRRPRVEGSMHHVFSPAAYLCFLVEVRCACRGQPTACASHSSAGACLRCLGFEMYEIGKGKGSGRAKFRPSWPVLVQDFAANCHRDHRSSPVG